MVVSAPPRLPRQCRCVVVAARLAPNHWKLRKAVAVVNQALDQLKLEKHPDKTFIGKIEKGFDFLGYHFSPDGLSVVQPTLERFIEKATRLYEQEAGKPEGFPVLGLYVERWGRWALGAGRTSELQRV